MWQKLTATLANKTAVTHAIAVAGAGLVAAYTQVPAFHDLVSHWYSLIPAVGKTLAVTGVFLYSWYRNGNK